MEADAVREDQKILTNDWFGDLDKLGLGAVDKMKVLAQVRQMLFAIKTLVAWPGVGSHDSHPGRKAFNPFPNLFHNSGQFMAEHCRGDDHSSVEPLTIDLQIRSAGQRRFYPNQNLARFNPRDRNLLDADIALPI
jgi:hypothetical protein